MELASGWVHMLEINLSLRTKGGNSSFAKSVPANLLETANLLEIKS